jgi:hypothetical protein
MSQGTEHHLEEAQHTPHLAADPFDKRADGERNWLLADT